MKHIARRLPVIALAALTACTIGPPKERPTALDAANAALREAAEARPAKPSSEAVLQSLLPPMTATMPRPESSDLTQRFDLTVTNASAPQVLNAIVSGTAYSMVIHPGIRDSISLTLKNVTIPEVLNTVREIYGYDYRIEGTLIYVLPAALQTRLFKVEYLTGSRRGTTDMRVASNAVEVTPGGSGAAARPATAAVPGALTTPPGQSTYVETASINDFWRETYTTLSVLTGCVAPTTPPNLSLPLSVLGCDGANGRRLIVSPQSGTVLVRAMPDELKSIATFLRTSQATVERQVLIEAKILEVALNDGFETGINWAGFFTRVPGETSAVGMLTPGTRLGTTGSGVLIQGSPLARNFPNPLTAGVSETGAILGGTGRALDNAITAAGSIFGFAFQGKNFAALLSFLESQGVVHTLSSPRIATMNNQKAVLKVGNDSLFVTRITGGSTQAATTIGLAPTVTSPTFDVQSFFSGIALDVTPRINDDGTILLHVRPSVTDVTQSLQTFNLGALGVYTIPLVTNAVSETDSVIRAGDGQIVAIGGLMRNVQKENRNQVPGIGNLPYLGAAFRNVSQTSEKRELVILIKLTVVQGEDTWAKNILDTRDRVQNMDRGFSWGARSEVLGTERENQVPFTQPPPK